MEPGYATVYPYPLRYRELASMVRCSQPDHAGMQVAIAEFVSMER